MIRQTGQKKIAIKRRVPKRWGQREVAGRSGDRGDRRNVSKSLYCGFQRQEQVRQRKKVCNWLSSVMSVGSGAWGFSSHLVPGVRPSGQVGGNPEYEGPQKKGWA